jgi:hypothetical protein
MDTYEGRLWLVPDRETTLGVEIHLDEGSLKITSNDTVIGEWDLSEVLVREIGRDNVRLVIEGEEVVVSSGDPDFMPALVGPTAKKGKHAQLSVSALRPEPGSESEAWSFARDVAAPESKGRSSTRESIDGESGHRAGARASRVERGSRVRSRPKLWKW